MDEPFAATLTAAQARIAAVRPAEIRQGRTGVPVMDKAVRALYATGTLHNQW